MTTVKNQQDSFTDGMSKFAEAARHSMTASRLAAAGTMALGAATYVYFADPERREAAMNAATRMFDGATKWWESTTASPKPEGKAATAPKGAAGIA